MSKDKYSYIALFTYEEDGISIKFPDLPGCYRRCEIFSVNLDLL